MRHTNFPDNGVKQFNWRVIKHVFPYLLEFKLRLFVALLCLIITKLASVYLPFILKDLVDTLEKSNTDNIVLVPFALIAAYGVVRLSIVLFAEIRDTLFGKVTERAIRRIGLKVFQHLHQLELSFHLERQTGGISRDIDRGTSGISFLMRFMIFNILPTLFEIILVIGILFFNYGVSFALITLVSIMLYVAYSIYATEWRTGFIREANQADSSSNTRAIDSLLNYETVKYFTNETYEVDAYDKKLAKWEQAKTKNRLSLFALNGGQAFIISLSMTTMLGLAAYQVAHEQISLGDFVLINAFMMQLFLPLNFLGFVYREIKGSLANIENMFNLLEREPLITDKANAQELQVTKGNIHFDHVSFYYHQDRIIIDDITININHGEKVAIVGESGSGKSTLVKLLFRFYDVSAGAITIDGQAINDITQNSLRKSIGIVPQDTVLFNDTIFENVKYGCQSATDEEVHNAITMAHLSTFIHDLPDKEFTIVGERGLKLSGGEKQRVSIARTILKNPDVLVFDEATSSLDSQSEQAILKAINEVSINRTSIVIAHRLSTIIDADNIIVMSKGRIVEQGNHQALLIKNGMYANMWQLQQQEK